jgi:hypothetical protein
VAGAAAVLEEADSADLAVVDQVVAGPGEVGDWLVASG